MAVQTHKRRRPHRDASLASITQQFGINDDLLGERKFHASDGRSASDPVDATGSNVLCTGIVQGVGDQQRIGRRIICTGLELSFMTILNKVNGSTHQDPDLLRVLIVVDHQTNKGASVDLADILHDVGDGSRRVTQHYNPYQLERFTILHDQVYYAGRHGAGGIVGAYVQPGAYTHNKIKIALPNIPIDYDGAAGTVGQLTSNSIYIWYVSYAVSVRVAIGEFMLHYYDA